MGLSPLTLPIATGLPARVGVERTSGPRPAVTPIAPAADRRQADSSGALITAKAAGDREEFEAPNAAPGLPWVQAITRYQQTARFTPEREGAAEVLGLDLYT